MISFILGFSLGIMTTIVIALTVNSGRQSEAERAVEEAYYVANTWVK